MRKVIPIILSLIMLLLISAHAIAEAEIRIKEMVSFEKWQEVELFGYGLIVGLNGTGDKGGATFTVQSVSNMLQKMGITVDPDNLRIKNVAAVIVTATLSPFIRKGSHIDVMVSSLGDSTSLQGGTLLPTPLQEMGGTIYALAQGPVSIGGFNVAAGGGSVQKNHPTVGRIPDGAMVREEISLIMPEEELSLILSRPDFTTASRMSEIINEDFSQSLAKAVDPSTVKVEIPQEYQKEGLLISFISRLENLSLVPDRIARVVINERTGTVVVGEGVKIFPVAVAHGGLLITITQTPIISQPPPFSEKGETVVTEKTDIEVTEEQGRLALVQGTTVQELINALNALGITPRDVIAIFQALKEAEALQAELVIM